MMMKKFVSILAITFGMGIFLIGCNDDEPVQYWYSYGTYYETNESATGFVVDMDNGKLLIPSQASGIESNLADSARVVVVYSIVSESDSSVTASVTDVSGILTKNILQLTDENEDSIGNDGILVQDNDIWFSDYHLNVNFAYYYAKKHFINLVKPIGEQLDSEGNQILEFRHNANDDYMYSVYNGVVSFDMRSLYVEGMDSINILFKSIDYDSSAFTWKGTYHFNKQSSTKDAVIGEPLLHQQIY